MRETFLDTSYLIALVVDTDVNHQRAKAWRDVIPVSFITDWGITDCISFVGMHREGTYDALTADHHFVQAGFRALLRIEPEQEARWS